MGCGDPTLSIFVRENDMYLRRIGTKLDILLFLVRVYFVGLNNWIHERVMVAKSFFVLKTGTLDLRYVNMVLSGLVNFVPKSRVSSM